MNVNSAGHPDAVAPVARRTALAAQSVAPLRCRFMVFAVVVLHLVLSPPRAHPADWPTYRGDAARSGYTAETIPNQLRLRWQRRASRPPQPAWPTSERM